MYFDGNFKIPVGAYSELGSSHAGCYATLQASLLSKLQEREDNLTKSKATGADWDEFLAILQPCAAQQTSCKDVLASALTKRDQAWQRDRLQSLVRTGEALKKDLLFANLGAVLDAFKCVHIDHASIDADRRKWLGGLCADMLSVFMKRLNMPIETADAIPGVIAWCDITLDFFKTPRVLANYNLLLAAKTNKHSQCKICYDYLYSART
eukprot:6491152-Amphidinium_carterae.1